MPKSPALIFAALLAACALTAVAHAQTQPTVVIVVRHAEKATSSPQDPDPPLSEAGAARAQKLKDVTAGTEIAAVYTTQFRRTRDTGAVLGVPVIPVEVTRDNAPTYAASLAKEILSKHKGKTVMVVGHSNTTPQIVEALSGKRVPPLDDAKDFDALYVVVLTDNAPPRLVRGKY